MSIRPIDVMTMQQINEVTQIKQNDSMRPVAQQMNITQEIQKEVNTKAEQVNKKDDADKSDRKFDARDKSDNEYYGQKKNKDNKDGRVTVKIQGESSFDMKV
ncbi:MAG: hypothetical protein IJB96_07570 [Lachnospira sp.]|nr:hypothetical protein [Lachnospira sp.]